MQANGSNVYRNFLAEIRKVMQLFDRGFRSRSLLPLFEEVLCYAGQFPLCCRFDLLFSQHRFRVCERGAQGCPPFR